MQAEVRAPVIGFLGGILWLLGNLTTVFFFQHNAVVVPVIFSSIALLGVIIALSLK